MRPPKEWAILKAVKNVKCVKQPDSVNHVDIIDDQECENVMESAITTCDAGIQVHIKQRYVTCSCMTVHQMAKDTLCKRVKYLKRKIIILKQKISKFKCKRDTGDIAKKARQFQADALTGNIKALLLYEQMVAYGRK